MSDDDYFDNAANEEFLNVMGKGVLPPELQVLHGTCLIGEGGKEFLAEKLISAMKLLSGDQHNEIMHFTEDNEAANQTPLDLFRGAMLDSLNKPSGFAFFTDFILKTNKHTEWSERLLPIYDEYVKEIESCQEVDILKMNPFSLPLQMSRKRNYYLKVLLFLLQLKLNKAHNANNSGDPGIACELANDIIQTIQQYSITLLHEINNRQLPDESVKVRLSLNYTMETRKC